MMNLDFNAISNAVFSLSTSDFIFTDQKNTFVAITYNHQNVVGKKVVFAVRGETSNYFLRIAEQMHLEVIYRSDIANALFDEFYRGKQIDFSHFIYLTDLFKKHWHRGEDMTEEALFKEEVLKTLATKITEEKFIFYNDVFNLYNDEISQIPDNKEPLTPEELFQIFEKESATLKEKYNLTVNKGKDFRGFEKLDLGLDVDEDITKYCSLVFDTEQCKIIVGWMPVYDFFHFYEYKKVLKLLDIFFGCDTSPLKMRINTIKDKYQMNFKSAEIAKNTVELFARQLLTSKGISYKVIYSANTGTLKIRKSQELIYEIGFSFPEINSNPAAFINLLKDIKPLAGEELYCVEKVDFYA